MKRYFSNVPKRSVGSHSIEQPVQTPNANTLSENVELTSNLDEIEINQDDIVSDPGLRKPIESFNVNIRDRIIREYTSKGPYQPHNHIFPKKKYGKDNRSFRDAWFKDNIWLEYSIAKDAAFCFWCFLFKLVFTGDEAFTTNGFGNWKKAIDKYRDHDGSSSSAHNKARIDFENFQNQKQSVAYIVKGTNLKSEQAYRIHLTTILDVIHYLLGQGLAFRGHDESSTSLRKGNFLELVHGIA